MGDIRVKTTEGKTLQELRAIGKANREAIKAVRRESIIEYMQEIEADASMLPSVKQKKLAKLQQELKTVGSESQGEPE